MVSPICNGNYGGDILFKNGFPNSLINDVSTVEMLIPLKTYRDVRVGVSEQTIEYCNNGVEIKFPYRIYFVEVSNDIISKLTLQQKMILHCIYSRSCDGFVRQKHLQSLLMMDYADWSIPYIVKPCDEYVIEILEMTYNTLKDQNTELFKSFCNENVQSFCESYNRMVSYWNEFYRDRCYKFYKYVGRKLFRECFGYSH